MHANPLLGAKRSALDTDLAGRSTVILETSETVRFQMEAEMKKLRVAAIALVLSTAFLSQTASAGRAECFAAYVRDAWNCAEMTSFWDRFPCGLDAFLTLTGCVVRSVAKNAH